MALPRLLPIIAVAVAGVFALKAISSLDMMPDVFKAAEAFAQDTKKTAKPAKGEADKADDPTRSFGVDPALMAADAASQGKEAAAPVAMAPICATSVDDLARQAGISSSEMTILQNLRARSAQLDAREQALNSRAQLIEAADAKLDARINQLSDLKNQIQALIDQATKVADDDTNRLVAVYSAMKPKDAAAIFATMSDDVRLPIAAKMKDRALAAILGAMEPNAARELTEKLARRMQRADGLQQQLDKTTAGGPNASAAPANAAAKPAAGAPAAPAKKG